MSAETRKPCPVCGEMIVATAIKCRYCGEVLDESALSGTRGEGDTTGGLIPYKNTPALIGYYCGVFSILPCFPIGLAGLVLGIMGLRNVKRNPQVRGTAHAWIGIFAGGLFGFGYLALTILVMIGVMSDR